MRTQLLTLGVLSAGLLLAACRGGSAPPSRLELAVQASSSQPPCDTVIPMEWPASLPVPSAGGAGEYRVFFYPLGEPESLGFVNAPLGEAVIKPETGGAASCRRLEGELRGLGSRRWPEAVDEMEPDELERRLGGLYASTEKAARLYAAKAPLKPEDRKVLGDYSRRFLELAEPPLRPYYYRLNPDFWDWLGAQGLPTLPRA